MHASVCRRLDVKAMLEHKADISVIVSISDWVTALNPRS